MVRRQARRANAELMNEWRGEQSDLEIKQRRARGKKIYKYKNNNKIQN